MQIYMLLDDPDPRDVAEPFMAALQAWLQTQDVPAELVDERAGEAQDWLLGIRLKLTHKKQLRKPLSFLYGEAKKRERDFVVGIYVKDSNEREDVCYFGFEEGRPDADEMAMYLGL